MGPASRASETGHITPGRKLVSLASSSTMAAATTASTNAAMNGALSTSRRSGMLAAASIVPKPKIHRHTPAGSRPRQMAMNGMSLRSRVRAASMHPSAVATASSGAWAISSRTITNAAA
jgi:hypothetical protein